MKKRLFAIFTALTLCLTMLPTVALAAEGDTWDGRAVDIAWYNTDDTNFSISTAAELAGLAQIVNGTAGAQDSFAGKTITLMNDIDLGHMSWTPIGTSGTPFQGTFDGNSHSIKRLSITVTSNDQGLLGYMKDADICNVTLSDVLISGDTNIGGIAGVAVSSTIKNCTVNSNAPIESYGYGIRGSESVGGIVGCSQDSHIQSCTNNAYVYLLTSGDESARHKLGGIVGVATLSADPCSEGDAVLITDCINTGPITCTTEANYECTGGIVGRLVSDNADYRAIVKGCKNTGLVSSIEAGTGGIVGYAQNASIENCRNENNITGTTGVGGIAGYAYYGTQILSCTNSGSVTGNTYDTTVYPYNIGGIVGSIYNPRDTTHLEGDCDSLPVYSYNRDSLISNCTNSGAVTCNFDWPEAEPAVRLVDGVPYAINIYGSFVGGIAGFAVDSAFFDEEGNIVRITGCENYGSVTGKTYAGGVLGIGKNADVTGCTNSGIVTNADVSDSDSIRADIGGYSYTVWFDANGGEVEKEDTLKMAAYGVLDAFPTPTRNGCTFDGWFTDAVGDTAVTTGTVFNGNTTIYAHWTPSNYTVKLNTNGGTINSGDVTGYTYGQGATLPTATDMTYTGYTFKGWYDNQGLSGEPVTAISDTDTDKKEYWAKWEINEYTITFETNGGTEIAPKTNVKWTDTVLDGVSDPARSGFSFDGWKCGDITVTAQTTYSELVSSDAVTSIELNAQWKDIAAPVISGVENGKTYCSAQLVSVSDNDVIKSVTVNGNTVTLNENNQFTLSPEGKQTIIVTDKAGNVSAEMIVTVNDGHRGGTATCTSKAVCVHCGNEYGDLDSDNHTAGTEIRDAKEAGCTKEGYTGDTYCKGCGEKLSSGVAIAKLAHTDENKDHLCDVCQAKLSEHTGGEATCKDKAVCSYCGKEYGEVDSSNHNLEKIPAKDATVTETGNKEYWHCKDCGKNFSDKDSQNSIELKDTVTPKLPPEIIEGKGQNLSAGEKKELTFRSDAAFSDFIRVELDGKTLGEENYTVKEGSTIVTLKTDYVGVLSAGEHTIGIVSTSGTATTTFTVNAKAEADNDTKSPQTGNGTADVNANPAVDNNSDSPHTGNGTADVNANPALDNDSDSPQTGDNSYIALWVVILFVSSGLLTVTGAYRKKKKRSKR